MYRRAYALMVGTAALMGGLALLRPGTSVFGAILLACIMVGAILTHLFLIPGSALPALVLLLLCLFIAWGRRASFRTVFSR